MRALPSDFPVCLDSVGVRVASGTALLSEVSTTIERGGPIALIGPNGAGKTTLLRVLMGLTRPTNGRITWGGHAEAPADRRAMVFQRPVMLRRSVAANIAYALEAAGRDAGHASVLDLLTRVGLTDLAARPARRLSGGEQQRLAIARALARRPEIPLLDEPTASLDPSSTKAVETIVAAAAAEGVTVVFSTHDLGQARRLAARVLFLAFGRLVEDAEASSFFKTPATPKARAFLAGDLVEQG
jgi:tungstate transport system ATP-binding protein